MGSPSDAEDSGIFEDTKGRIDRAFEHLRKEMKEIQRQDIFLLKQLMHIRHTILLLGRYGDRRCYSIGALDPSAQEVVSRTDMTPPLYRMRPSLTRVQSAPLETRVSEDIIMEEDENEDDELAQSFNSTVSESHVTSSQRDMFPGPFGTPAHESDFIYAMGPLPPVFQRLLASSTSGTTPLVSYGDQTDNQNILQHLSTLKNISHVPKDTGLGSEKSLLKQVARKRMLQRQKSVEEYETVGNMVLDNLQRLHTSTSSTEVEV